MASTSGLTKEMIKKKLPPGKRQWRIFPDSDSASGLAFSVTVVTLISHSGGNKTGLERGNIHNDLRVSNSIPGEVQHGSPFSGKPLVIPLCCKSLEGTSSKQFIFILLYVFTMLLYYALFKYASCEGDHTHSLVKQGYRSKDPQSETPGHGRISVPMVPF